MHLRRLLALATLCFLAMSNSCKKDEDVVPCNAAADVTIAQVTGFKARIIEPVPNVGQSNYYVVNSVAEYQELFAGKKPAIDFATHTLLAGKTRTPTGSHVQAQQVAQTCTGYTYSVQLAADSTTAAANVVYYVLVPKIVDAAKVAFDVQLPLVAPSEGVSTISGLK
jgi:hypothetical protein